MLLSLLVGMTVLFVLEIEILVSFGFSVMIEVFLPLQPRMVMYERTMNDRGDHIKVLKDKMNTVEDEIFEQFCLQIGVENIRLIGLSLATCLQFIIFMPRTLKKCIYMSHISC